MMQERIYTVIQAPLISEKSSIAAAESNQYVFKVTCDATKLEIKKAVEKLFNVKVERVQVLNVKGKVKRNRYGLAKKPSWKKAYVRLAEGHDIDLAVAE
jgi:large subunit ribosomal protein L23